MVSFIRWDDGGRAPRRKWERGQRWPVRARHAGLGWMEDRRLMRWESLDVAELSDWTVRPVVRFNNPCPAGRLLIRKKVPQRGDLAYRSATFGPVREPVVGSPCRHSDPGAQQRDICCVYRDQHCR